MELTCICVLKVDTNKDRLVSLEEFLKSTEKKEFNNPKEWEVQIPEVAWRLGKWVGGSNTRTS